MSTTKMPKITGRQDDAASAASTKAAGGCYYCRQDGHVKAECPQLAAKKVRAAHKAERQCHFCGQRGHVVAQCAAKLKSELRKADRKCRFCFQSGHLRAECPQQAAQQEAEKAYFRAPPAMTLGQVGLVTRQ